MKAVPFWKGFFCAVAVALIASGCATNPPTSGAALSEKTAGLFTVAEFPDQVTGVAVSSKGRIFVNFPRWGSEPKYSVAELLPDGSLRPYPDQQWNGWGKTEVRRPQAQFICVQSVYVDDDDNLWILDPASPSFSGVVPGGAKLVKVNLDNDKVERVVQFNGVTAPRQSYLNDVRVDPDEQVAYITDSGLGALVVLDLDSGESRRVLADHYSTKAESGVVPVVEKREVRDQNGVVAKIHADGIALDPDGKYLYFHALTARSLYRVPTDALNDPALSPAGVAVHVEKLAETGPTDGMAMDQKGTLYWTALEQNAVKYWRRDRSGTVVESNIIQWPDTLAVGPDQYLYFTASQIHRMPRYNNGVERRVPPYRLFKVWVAPF